MNKYQEAYKLINGESIFNSLTLCDERYKENMKALDILRELVDKATPKKIKIYGNDIFCPECEECVSSTYELPDIIDELKYCPYCGQAINLKEWDGNEKDY